MTVAYVMEQYATITRESERLLIKKDGDTLHTLHLNKVDQLCVMGNVLLTPAVIRVLLRRNIDTTFMTLRGRYLGRLQPLMGKNILLRKEQFRRLDDASFALAAARSIVAGKCANMRTVLMRLNRNREEENLSDNILQLRNLVKQAAAAESIETVRGYEGRAAVVYFNGLAKGISEDGFTFVKRTRRPPTDPINALLSLGYTLLFNAVQSATAAAGFDPYLGCLHEIDYGRPSLALDLMEEWRPVIIDTLVLSVINLKVLTPDDFVIEPEWDESETGFDAGDDSTTQGDDSGTGEKGGVCIPVRLTDAGFRKYIAQFERKLAQRIHYAPKNQNLTYRDCIREQVYHFARYVRGEEKEYRPMIIK